MRLSIILSIFTILHFYSCTTPNKSKPDTDIQISDFNFPDVTIRALAVLNDSTVWFAGSKGVWGYTNNNGLNWHIDTIKIENAIPELRSIKITPNGNVFLINISNPAAVFRSIDQGENWKMVYSDTIKNAFFDAVNFWDDANGILLGDAIDGCFHFAETHDNGKTWARISCDSLPTAQLNENPFAASNSNIAMEGSSVWIPMGGKSPSQVYYSNNYGKKWKSSSTPIIWGETMTGIFSVDFLNDSVGVVAGGNWEEVELKCANLALTKDGGKSWSILNNSGNAGYISCIQWLPETNGNRLITMTGRGRPSKSTIGIYDFSTNKWTVFNNPKSYLAIKCASKNVAWVSGKHWIGKLTISN